MEHFWPELKQFRKWKIINPEVRIDQIIVENLPGLGTGQWRLARVVELIPSSDGKIRHQWISLGVTDPDKHLHRYITCRKEAEAPKNDGATKIQLLANMTNWVEAEESKAEQLHDCLDELGDTE